MSGRAKRGFFNDDGLWIQYWAPLPEAPEERAVPLDYTADLILALSILTEKQRFVIECRYGLRGEALTVCQISTLMGVSHQSVVRLEQRALGAMRRGLQQRPMGANTPFLDTERPAAGGSP